MTPRMITIHLTEGINPDDAQRIRSGLTDRSENSMKTLIFIGVAGAAIGLAREGRSEKP
jgi:hypothetical protein